MSLLNKEFEYGDKFYEPQYWNCGGRGRTAVDEELTPTYDIKFRESEALAREETAVVEETMRQLLDDYSDFFI